MTLAAQLKAKMAELDAMQAKLNEAIEKCKVSDASNVELTAKLQSAQADLDSTKAMLVAEKQRADKASNDLAEAKKVLDVSAGHQALTSGVDGKVADTIGAGEGAGVEALDPEALHAEFKSLSKMQRMGWLKANQDKWDNAIRELSRQKKSNR